MSILLLLIDLFVSNFMPSLAGAWMTIEEGRRQLFGRVDEALEAFCPHFSPAAVLKPLCGDYVCQIIQGTNKLH